MDTTFCHLSLALAAPGLVMTPRVAVAVANPEAEIWATDVNATAVQLAAENAERHGIADRVRAVETSLLDGVPTGLDLVLANLPYLPERLRGQTAYDDEPWCAIYAAGDGLGHYRALLDAAEEHLAENGAIAIQLHRRVHDADRRRLEQLHANVESYADLAA